MRGAAALLAAALLLNGCAASPFARAGWERFNVEARGRVLAAAMPVWNRPGPVLTVVLEGDGRAHDVRGRASADPTPGHPVGFEIARAWPEGPVVWLGRLCQYVRQADPQCRPADWTRDRFSATAIQATDAAIDELKLRSGAQRVRLVGWSGGGVLAAAVARRRDDVAGLVTFAAPLDLASWTQLHRISPLEGATPSISPLPMPQVHFYGAKDTVTPPTIGVGPARALAGPDGVVRIVDATHGCCWAEHAAAAATQLAAVRSTDGPPPPGPPPPGSTH